MKTFQKFLEAKILTEADAPPPGGVANSPPPAPGGDSLGGGMPPPPPPMGGGMPPPPMGGGMSPLGGPPMGGAPGAPTGQTAPTKLKAFNVWDVLERLLGSEESPKNLKNG